MVDEFNCAHVPPAMHRKLALKKSKELKLHGIDGTGTMKGAEQQHGVSCSYFSECL